MAIVNKFNVNNKQVTLDADIIENMSANDVSYDDSFQYDENSVGDKLSELEKEVIYDVSAHNNGAVFESLSALLSHTNISTIIPPSDRIGGMSISFIQSSDNKYVQYRLMTTTWSFDINDWQGVDDEPTAGSDNLVKSGGVFPTFNAVNKALLPIKGKVSIIGDSISAFKGTLPPGYAEYYPRFDVTSLYDMWWHIILSLTNSKLEVNASWIGSMVTNKRSGEGIPDFYDRTNILGSPDYIFVALGTNDNQISVALGDYDYDSENLSESEFIPAYIKGVKALKTSYPKAKIILFIFYMDIKYSMSIKNIGKHYGLDVIDVSSYYVDNVNPNKEQMSIVAQTISTFYTSNDSQLEFKITETLIGGERNVWSVLKPIGNIGVTYPFIISPGTQVIISLSGVSESDTVYCTFYDKNGVNLGACLVADKKDTEINYLATNGLSHLRVSNNANSSVTLSIRKAITEEALNQKIEEVSNQTEEELTNFKMGSSKIMSTVMIPQRESTGGSNFPLSNTLKGGIPYNLTKTCSSPSKYNNFRFSTSEKSVNFYIDGTYITGYAIVSDGVHTLVLDDDATFIRSTDNTETSVEIEIAENLGGLYQTEKYIQELYPLLEDKPLYDYTVKNQSLCIDDYISSIGAYRLMASYNGFNFSDQLNNNRIANIKYENTVHDSQIVVKGDIAYVVYAANTVISDNAGSPTSKVILTKFNINDFVGTRVDLEVAKSGSNQQTGGAGQPNIVADETDVDLLHIVYTCNNNGYTIFTCDYSVSNGNCSNYREVVVSNKAGETGNLRNGDINRLFDKKFTGNDSVYHSQQCNSTIAYSVGYYYIGMVIAESYLQDKNLAVIFKTQDFTNWDHFADYDSFNEPCLCELAIGADSNGNIYSASRPSNLYSQNMGQYGATYGVIAKWDSKGVLKDRRYYRNCGTRPSFFNYNDNLYLVSNTWYRSICDIIKVNTEQLCASQLLAQFKKGSFHYISFALYGDYVIVSSSSNNIEVSKITWPVSISEADAYNKLRTIIM